MPTVQTAAAHPVRRADRAPAAIRRRQIREALIGAAVTAVAMAGIAAVVLIFVFVAKEAAPTRWPCCPTTAGNSWTSRRSS